MFARCTTAWLLVSLLEQLILVVNSFPADLAEGSHSYYLSHDFYHVHLYEYDATILNAADISLTESPHPQLSNSDDFPEIIETLDFEFKFYGHYNDWIAISPNGFLTTHAVDCSTEKFCNWNEEVNGGYRRYIAPLLVDLNMNQSNESNVFVQLTDSHLSVQWSNVGLYGQSGTTDRYTFQATIDSDGVIYFYYFNMSRNPSSVYLPAYDSYYNHETGLEDAAYIYDTNPDGTQSLSVLPYAPLSINYSTILRYPIITFNPKPTCIDQISCNDCKSFNNHTDGTPQCGWCTNSHICSDGMGREYSELVNGQCYDPMDLQFNLSNGFCDWASSMNETRYCNHGTRVMARSDAESDYHSGTIVRIIGSSFYIEFDATDVDNITLANDFVHPCYTVSHNYDSNTLPGTCQFICAPATNVIGGGNSGKPSTITIIIIVAVISSFVFCVFMSGWVNRNRDRFERGFTTSHPRNNFDDVKELADPHSEAPLETQHYDMNPLRASVDLDDIHEHGRA